MDSKDITGYAQGDIMLNEMVAQFEKMRPSAQIEFLQRIGVGVSKYYSKQKFSTCARCGKVKQAWAKNDKLADFYQSTEVGVQSHITPICKDCARQIADSKDKDSQDINPSRKSMINSMEWLRKPFLESLYNSAVAATANGESQFDAYIRLVQNPSHAGETFSNNSDFYHVSQPVDNDSTFVPLSSDAAEQFEKNKYDCLRLIGYLPFEDEDAKDQPYLYADLVGFLGSVENANENYMRVRSMIGIVRWFLQLEKIDNTIARLSMTTSSMDANMSAIKGLQDTKAKITDTITKMADDSRISLKSNRDNVKGANTFTGKLSRLKDLNIRASYVNGFDLETCKAMQQVADISNASILKQLNLDESEWSDMVGEQRKMITKLTNQTHSYQEAARILLKENEDLRQTLSDNGLLKKDNLVDLSEIVNTYWIEGESNERDTESDNL